MNLVENRLASFERWPFIGGDCRCTPERMSEAGFYHCPTEEDPDLARCYVCFMELHCWERPATTRSRSTCAHRTALLSVWSKKAEDLTVRDFLEPRKRRVPKTEHTS
ncbi:hypothetical protein MTO96_005104 [Rhipicephalus appendiculatus]